MHLRKPLPAQILLPISLLGAFGFLGYSYLPTFLLLFKEAATVCMLALFFGLALTTRPDARWVLYVVLPALLLVVLLPLYAVVFTQRVDAPLLPSLLSQRYYTFILIGPVVYMLCRRGWKLADFQQLFLLAALLVLASFVVSDMALAPVSVLLSGQAFVLVLGATFADIGAELRALNGILLFLMLYFGRRLLQTGNPLRSGFSFAVLAVSTTILIITIPRTLIAASVASLLLYGVFLSRPAWTKLAMVMSPLYLAVVILSFPYLSDVFLSAAAQERSYKVRAEEVQTAWRFIQQFPLLGFGSDSVRSVSFQDLFGQFYPGDIGLLGVTFQYGLLGLALYMVFVGWLCVNLLRLVWTHAQKIDPKQRAFLWALLLTCLTFAATSPLQARFLFPDGQGVPIGAFAWGLLVAYKHGAGISLFMSPPKPSKPVRVAPEIKAVSR